MRKGLLIAIVLVIAVVLAAVFGLLAFYHAGTVSITLTSDHVLNTVDVVVTCDGRVCLQGQLAPLQSSTNDWSVTWFGASCKTVTVVATSTGGGRARDRVPHGVRHDGPRPSRGVQATIESQGENHETPLVRNHHCGLLDRSSH